MGFDIISFFINLQVPIVLGGYKLLKFWQLLILTLIAILPTMIYKNIKEKNFNAEGFGFLGYLIFKFLIFLAS